MPRAPVAVARAARRARVFNMARGFYGKRKNCYSIAKRAVDRAMQKMYIGRKEKKRTMRALWINRINAASRLHDTPYSRFMNDLVVSDVHLNRKVLSELAIHEPKSFGALVTFSQQRAQANREKPGLLSLFD
eukprot:m.114818 g.114818  ORF g.114818 m.114818 type:complete len:132 (+) comp10859_c0_seq2:55-450(+)